MECNREYRKYFILLIFLKMNEINKNLDDYDIHDFGNEIQISGVVYSGKGQHIVAFFPKEVNWDEKIIEELFFLDMDLDDWKKFLRQSDIMETEVLAKAKDGKITKAILRKSARQIDQRVAWKVYKRDHYKCRYCGASGVPLTVDHLVLWENGGPTTEENLFTSCKKCNKTRGNMPYEEWIEDERYLVKSFQGVDPNVRQQNKDKVKELANIPRVYHIKSR